MEFGTIDRELIFKLLLRQPIPSILVSGTKGDEDPAGYVSWTVFRNTTEHFTSILHIFSLHRSCVSSKQYNSAIPCSTFCDHIIRVIDQWLEYTFNLKISIPATHFPNTFIIINFSFIPNQSFNESFNLSVCVLI